MSIFKQICSHCHRNFWQCRCDAFHPPIDVKDTLELSVEEVASLIKYFTERAGYISYEFDEPVHAIIAKMNVFLGNVKG